MLERNGCGDRRSRYKNNWRLFMAQMGLGYGSEYQLLRFLGHHREELEGIILRSAYELKWLNYPKELISRRI
jgi:hypothetical protein